MSYESDKEIKLLNDRIEDLEKELGETQFDLAEESKENEDLREQNVAMKLSNPKQLQEQCAHLARKLQQAEALILSFTLAASGYHAN